MYQPVDSLFGAHLAETAHRKSGVYVLAPSVDFVYRKLRTFSQEELLWRGNRGNRQPPVRVGVARGNLTGGLRRENVASRERVGSYRKFITLSRIKTFFVWVGLKIQNHDYLPKTETFFDWVNRRPFNLKVRLVVWRVETQHKRRGAWAVANVDPGEPSIEAIQLCEKPIFK